MTSYGKPFRVGFVGLLFTLVIAHGEPVANGSTNNFKSVTDLRSLQAVLAYDEVVLNMPSEKRDCRVVDSDSCISQFDLVLRKSDTNQTGTATPPPAHLKAVYEFVKVGHPETTKYAFEKNSLPCWECHRGTNLVLTVGSIMVDDVYNSLRLSAKQRAGKVMPTLLQYIKTLSQQSGLQPEITGLGISMIYGVKDLTQEFATASPEFLMVWAPRSLINQLEQDDITDTEFLSRAEIYLRAQDSNELQRISLSIE